MSYSAKAVRITGEFGIDQLTFETIPVLDPGPREVLVALKAVSLNYRDLLVTIGKYNPKLPRPMTICSDGAGEVLAVGEGVTRFKPGDRVAGAFFQTWLDGPYTQETSKSALGGAIDGVLAQQRVFHETGLVRLPSHFSFEEGATLPCAAVTAWHGLVPTAHISSADTVLLLGTGGVSIFGLQFAKMHGARVILTSSSDEKLERAKALGADEVVNYKQFPDWEKEVFRLTDGKGADVVLEVGGAGTLSKSVRAVRAAGQVSLIGVLSGISEPISIGPILHGNLRLQGIYVGSVAMFEAMTRAVTTNQLRPVIDRVFAFEEAKEALRHMQSAQHFGKIVIRID